MRVPLDANSFYGNSLPEERSDMSHVVGQPVPGKNLIIVNEELCIGIALMGPLGHQFCDFRPKPLFIIVTVDHFIVQIVAGKPALVFCSDGYCPVLHPPHQFLIVQLLDPGLNEFWNTPEKIMSPQRYFVFIGPFQNPVDDGIIHLIPFLLHAVPLNRVLGNCRIEVLNEFLFILFQVLFLHPAFSKSVAYCTSEPEFMAQLFNADLCTRSGTDDYFPFPVCVYRFVQTFLTRLNRFIIPR